MWLLIILNVVVLVANIAVIIFLFKKLQKNKETPTSTITYDIKNIGIAGNHIDDMKDYLGI